MDIADLLTRARQQHAKIACAESCTGGMLSAALTAIPGASDVFDRGFITYSNAAKTDMLGVPPDTIATHGAVSEPTAAAMATGTLARSTATIAIAITGIAGPGGSDHKPEGRVCFGLARTGQPTETQTIDFGPLGRAQVRAAARDHALALIAGALTNPS